MKQRYRGYGSRVFTSASSVRQPNYQWVGAWGYRRTARWRSDVDVQDRCYSISDGRWSSTDKLWPTESAFSYCASEPINWVDPSGSQRQRPNLPVIPGLVQGSGAAGTGAAAGGGAGAAGYGLGAEASASSSVAIPAVIVVAGIVATGDLIRYGCTGQTGPATGIGNQIGKDAFNDPLFASSPMYLPSKIRNKYGLASCSNAGAQVHRLCDRQGKMKCDRSITRAPGMDHAGICGELRSRMSEARDCYRARIIQEQVCGPKGAGGKVDANHQDQLDDRKKVWLHCYTTWQLWGCSQYL